MLAEAVVSGGAAGASGVDALALAWGGDGRFGGARPCLRPAPGALRQEGWRRRVVVEQREQEQEQEQEPVRKLPQAPGWALFPRRATGWGRRCRPLLATAVLRVLTLLAGPKWWLGAGAVVVALVARRG